MTDPEITTHRALPGEDVIEAAADAYLAAFSRPPYGETAIERAGFIDRVRRYAGRDGFRLATSSDETGISGLALAVVAHPGDWYREQLAGQLTAAEAERWLGERCLEVVHLAVQPASEGHGIGSRLLDAVVADATAPTGILTVDPRADRARRLYERHGWQVVRDEITVGEHGPMELRARDL